MIISATTKSLEIQTLSTNVVNWTVSYNVISATDINGFGNNGVISTITDTVIMPAPNASEQNQLTFLAIENLGNSNTEIIIRINDGGTRSVVYNCVLEKKQALTYTKDGGFISLTENGSVKNYTTSASFEYYVASNKQLVTILKTATRTSIATAPFSVFDLSGNPGAGVLAGTNTANGVVPTSSTAGCPKINTFSTGSGYLASLTISNTVAGRVTLYDMLYKTGAHNVTTGATVMASQPSYASRIPANTNYNDTEIWFEAVTAHTGLLTLAIGYTNQSGVSGRSTGSFATGVAPTVGRMIMLPLQAGDTGVQKIDVVTASISTVGTFNILVLRRLASGRINVANGSVTLGLSDTGMPVVYSDSALFLRVDADSTSTGILEVLMNIVG